MTNTLENIDRKIKAPAKESLLTPRFYTTNFEEIALMDISKSLPELKAILKEFLHDYNRNHFIRDKEFDQNWNNLDEKTKNLFIEFLERSCTAEFSGFLLYKELSRRLKNQNSILANCFEMMSRDEARHAGFLNKAMADFNLSLDLGFLTKSRKYTFFSPKFIFYATFLSEKIGYWRYITIYRHLEKYPEYRIYPIFKFFESWCQDENRHGDFFAILLYSQPKMLNTFQSKLWCKFFLLSVFLTMYLNDLQRSDFYRSLGIDARQFDIQVIRKTNESAARVFPVSLNLNNDKFFKYFDNCARYNKKMIEIEKKSNNKIYKNIQKIPFILLLMIDFIKLFFLKSIDTKFTLNVIKSI
ncbi:magnesium-protoporphyrin IX monomethyl ester cyclase (chloroplast) [Galdieria partita]|uniref:Magnesium-protoporphyrin IX monomethyl ester [oxidative] cyclase n=1 Tax=Galdieria partita TaxID=83374 RepID=A0A9C7C8V7_9RHOD|nr:magnesium-protoporphyrin IX monomethyl ester cyclase [Galdieria partita]